MLALAGALATLAHVHTALWGLNLLCLAVLARAAATLEPRKAAWQGLLFGTGWMVASTWWLYISMHRYGGMPAPLAALAVLALALALSLYLMLALALAARWRSGRALRDASLFATLWLLAELARGVIFTGFPWAASGYAQVDGPLAAWAPWVGVYGIGFISAWLAALLAQGWLSRSVGPALLAVVVLAASPLLPSDHSRDAGTLQVSLMQTNVDQNDKFVPGRWPETLAWMRAQLEKAPGELVVAPETAFPMLPSEMPDGLWQQLQSSFSDGVRAALVGLPMVRESTRESSSGSTQEPSRYTNSALALNGNGAAYRYDKAHLVPFGEFVPTGFRWFVDLMHIPLGEFASGPVQAPSWAFRGQRLAPNICYEDLFGEELARRFALEHEAPTILVNLSNIAWFGRTIAIEQHLNISRMRSLELQRPMIRATNTGATAMIDHRGQVGGQLEPYQRDVLTVAVQGREGLTPYARWASAWGLWPLLLGALLLLVLLLVLRRGSRAFRASPSFAGRHRSHRRR